MRELESEWELVMYKSTPEQGRKGLCQSSASTLALALALRPSKRASEQCVGATEEHQRTCVRGKIPIKDSCGMKNTQKGDLKRVIFVYTKRRNDKGSLLPALRCSHILVTHLRQVSERASSLDASWLGDARHTCAVSRATQLIFHANIFLLLPLFLPHSTIFQRAPPFHHPQGPPRAIILSLNLLV